MKNTKTTSSLSVREAEEFIQSTLELLRSKPFNGQAAAALAFLAPDGYQPIVELQDDGGKMRRTTSANNWSPETGDIIISFRKEVRPDLQRFSKVRGSGPAEPSHISAPEHYAVNTPVARGSNPPGQTPQQELCTALEEVERQGLAFVALKWFRDEVLPSKQFSWAVSTNERRQILSLAIQDGLVLTSRIANPHSSFPTTTIRLNRLRGTVPSGSRFTPVRIQGEPLSASLLRDRG